MQICGYRNVIESYGRKLTFKLYRKQRKILREVKAFIIVLTVLIQVENCGKMCQTYGLTDELGGSCRSF
jgi:hypothetical protein